MPRPIAGNKWTRSVQPPPYIDSTPLPRTPARRSTLLDPSGRLYVIPPRFHGPQLVDVGGRRFGVPAGADVKHRSAFAWVRLPDGVVACLCGDGEVLLSNEDEARFRAGWEWI